MDAKKGIVAILLTTISVIVGLYLHFSTHTLNLIVSLVSANDSLLTSSYALLVVNITNLSNRYIKPIFFVNNGIDEKPWIVVSGPPVLPPHKSAIYYLEAPSPSIAVFGGKPFVIHVRDLTTGFYAVSPHYVLPQPPMPRIRNPYLTGWVYLVSYNMKVPYGWTPTWWKVNSSEFVAIQDVNSTVHLVIGPVLHTSGDWLMAGIQQTVDFPNMLIISVMPTFSSPIPMYPGYPACTSGVEIADGNRRVWILFTNQTKKPILLKREGTLTYALYFVPVEVGKWNDITVNLTSIYAAMNWTEPAYSLVSIENTWVYIKAVNLLAFVACYRGAPHGYYDVYFRYIGSYPLYVTRQG